VEHLARFGLERDPFRSESQLEFWFPSRGHVAAGKRLRRCVEQGKELCVLIGPVGSGTTTLLRALCEQLDPDRHEACLLVPLRGTRPEELRAMIARQLGIEVPAAERNVAMRELFATLVSIGETGRRAVLAIDEAHALAPEVLAELRALLQLEHEETRLLSVVLAGTPELGEAVGGDAGLAERVDLEVRLEPLALADAEAYLAHRLETAGGDPALFDASVLAAIVERAAGLPRRLNALADATLFEAHLAERARPTPEDVERAARDLPWARREAPPASPLDDGLGGSLRLGREIESEEAAESAPFADLELPEIGPELEGDVGSEIEAALGAGDEEGAPMLGGFADDRIVQAASFEDALDVREETAPGAWQSPMPLDDNDSTASRAAKPSAESDLAALPSEDELDDLFVDLVDEVEPER